MPARPTLKLLTEHPLRQRLNDEFHARPSAPLTAPVLVSHLVFKHGRDKVPAELLNLEALKSRPNIETLESSDGHLMLDAGDYRLRWELHTEFSSYTFFRNLVPNTTCAPEETAFDPVPADWITGIPGKLIVATHIELRATSERTLDTLLAENRQGVHPVFASRVADEGAWVFTDFKLEDGFSRFLVLNDNMTPRQSGRTVMRLLEIETYRIMASFGLPVAKEVGAWLFGAEKSLADLMARIGNVSTAEDERDVLADLTALATDVERSVAASTFRFGASRAYHGLVRQRIEELREFRIPGFPSIAEFMQRRLEPAMATCVAIARRQEEFSGRVARNSQLLRTRVDIELEQQNQQLLAQMNRRAQLQLRLQQTVEGLSVVVLTYYGSQLVQYLAKGTKALHHLDTDMITAAAIPLIAGLVFWGSRRLHHKLTAVEHDGHTV